MNTAIIFAAILLPFIATLILYKLRFLSGKVTMGQTVAEGRLVFWALALFVSLPLLLSVLFL